jgi:hypothetical protein
VSGDQSINRAQARVENLPADEGRAIDCLAGGMVRIFARLNKIETAYRDLCARVATLEERPRAPATTADLRRTTASGAPDTRGSSAASRFAHRKARSATDAATELLGNGKSDI